MPLNKASNIDFKGGGAKFAPPLPVAATESGPRGW